ncbi:MAG: hypothetical protein IJT12_05960 [Paludibacteraceae bacterium]|nr:hypothetical protein [Paludibacteraceae bacterium]
MLKKFFLFISAVLLSVTMQATVITQDLDLASKFSVWNAGTENASGTFNSTTLVFNVTKDWGGGALWYGTGASQLDASAYSQLVIELANACSKLIEFKVTYNDGTPDQSVQITAGGTRGVIELNGEYIKSMSVQLRASVPDAGSVDIEFDKIYLQESVGKRSLVTLDESHTDLGTNWSVQLSISTDKFADIHVGDQVIVNYTLGESDYQFQIRTSSPDGAIDAYPSAITPEASTSQLRFTLNSTDSANLHDKGIYINGKNMTINSVQIRKHAVLWRGSFTAPAAWSDNSFAISNASLPDMEDGNILCVHVTTATTGSQISFRHTWENYAPTIHKYFNATTAAQAPATFEFPITHTMLHQLGGEDLRYVGYNLTIDEIYVAEGTPTNTVAEFLTVSSAGMATYLLPFNVPVLPEGVEAYQLQNYGINEIWAYPVDAMETDKPVLIVADAGEYTFVSEPDASSSISSKTNTYSNGALIGTYQTIDPLEETTNGNYNYILGTDGGGNVAFYQVLDDGCSVAPYHAYLNCGYSANAGGAGAPMRIRFKEDTTTGVEDISNQHSEVSKVLCAGQLYIVRDNKIYTIQGQIVK